jgi:LacI family transcriptional regulator
MKKRPSLSDIAGSLGLSKTLVSLVLNNKEAQYGISPETSERVRQKAAELHYRPDRMAQLFRTGKTMSIGMVLPSLSEPGVAKMADIAEQLARKEGYALLCATTQGDPDQETQRIRFLAERNADGLLIVPTGNNPDLTGLLREEGLPAVLTGRPVSPNEPLPYVTADHFWGGHLVATHLLEQGCRALAVMSEGQQGSPAAADRLQGIVTTLADAGLSPSPSSHLVAGGPDPEAEMERQLGGLLQAGRLPDAIIALEDGLILPCLAAVQRLGLDVPGQVALAGFGDQPVHDLTSPPLTMVSQPDKQITEKAFGLLMQLMQQITPASSAVHLPVELIVRRSSLKAARS